MLVVSSECCQQQIEPNWYIYGPCVQSGPVVSANHLELCDRRLFVFGIDVSTGGGYEKNSFEWFLGATSARTQSLEFAVGKKGCTKSKLSKSLI